MTFEAQTTHRQPVNQHSPVHREEQVCPSQAFGATNSCDRPGKNTNKRSFKEQQPGLLANRADCVMRGGRLCASVVPEQKKERGVSETKAKEKSNVPPAFF